ncbi:uncharacterized protein LOC100162636 [Acyrthosiphon pisum]|uniref:ACYPI003781 protein n=1 Tax=Acyrthosiphon pisum TaxID=7029 RepID=C4WVV1_ACYPI|nr:uncharacterized protein LOC100162636 [Acyrthosiphon pisum]BAH72021.1 ACYPI003781 [Acyrthosiphon pisum]|eukprot:NP_001155542.1 uncharacterized protein LOC100162636 [Acyrthosiphon pisum]
MVHKCCVAGCREKYVKGLSLFKVPFHDAIRSKKWMNVIGINETRNKNYFVCEKHFKSCDFNHNGVGVNVKKLKLSAVPSLFLPVIEIVNEEYEHRHNNMELSVDFEEIELKNDNLTNENLALNRNEINDSICNENSPTKINDGTSKLLLPQSLSSCQEIFCVNCNIRQNILKTRQYYLKKLAEIKEEESKLPLSCPCENNENLKSNKQLMTPLDKICNYNFSTRSPKSHARRAFILDHSYTSTPSKLIKHKNENTKKEN